MLHYIVSSNIFVAEEMVSETTYNVVSSAMLYFSFWYCESSVYVV